MIKREYKQEYLFTKPSTLFKRFLAYDNIINYSKKFIFWKW